MVEQRKLAELKDLVEKQRRRKDQATGAIGQLLSQLEKNHGCKTEEAGRKLLAKLEKEAAEGEREYNEELKKFETEWASKLREQS